MFLFLLTDKHHCDVTMSHHNSDPHGSLGKGFRHCRDFSEDTNQLDQTGIPRGRSSLRSTMSSQPRTGYSLDSAARTLEDFGRLDVTFRRTQVEDEKESNGRRGLMTQETFRPQGKSQGKGFREDERTRNENIDRSSKGSGRVANMDVPVQHTTDSWSSLSPSRRYGLQDGSHIRNVSTTTQVHEDVEKLRMNMDMIQQRVHCMDQDL